MENNPQFIDPIQNPIPAENTIVSTVENDEEAKRKELSYKRTSMLFAILSVITLAFIVWEIVDIVLVGRA